MKLVVRVFLAVFTATLVSACMKTPVEQAHDKAVWSYRDTMKIVRTCQSGFIIKRGSDGRMWLATYVGNHVTRDEPQQITAGIKPEEICQ